MSRGVRIELVLTKRQAEAVLRSEGFTVGYGVRLPQDLQVVELRLRHAIVNALAAQPEAGER